MSTGTRLATELRRAWNGDPWHGPSVRATLDHFSAAQAAHRRARGSHTAWELVRHLSAWVVFARRRFDDPSATPTPAENFPSVDVEGEAAWQADCAKLGAEIEQLAQRVESLDDAALMRAVGDRGYTYEFMVDGVVQHLAYHAGQIAVLARHEETAGVIAPPPLIALCAIVVAELLQRAVIIGVPFSRWSGAPFVLGGAALAWWAHEHFVKARTPAAPWHPSRALVLDGPYRFTRNPMYTGFLLAIAGLGLLRANAWYLMLLIPTWAVLHWGVVMREERYLAKRFGEPYAELLARTHRWLA